MRTILGVMMACTCVWAGDADFNGRWNIVV